tara:strand:- start:692 stop:982 length:291 start_codon:yes stop_codon:yes gene_type:complete
MLIGRLIGWVLVLAGIIVGVRDGVTWQETGTYPLTSTGEVWYSLHSESLNTAQAAVQRYLSPEVWDPGIQTVLLWPAVATFVGLGVIFLLLFRRRG